MLVFSMLIFVFVVNSFDVIVSNGGVPVNGKVNSQVTNVCSKCRCDHLMRFCNCGEFYNAYYLTSSVSKIHMTADRFIYCDGCLPNDATIDKVIDKFSSHQHSS